MNRVRLLPVIVLMLMSCHSLPAITPTGKIPADIEARHFKTVRRGMRRMVSSTRRSVMSRPASCWSTMERNTGCAMMASDSKDGAIIARGIELCGNIPVRGSSSKGGSKAAKAMVRLLRKGHPAAITPDGPRGPRHELQSGILMISAMSGCPIVPYHFVADRQWVFTSWDRHRLPKPFSTVWISVGKPYSVDRKRLAEEPEAVQLEVTELMMANVENAERLASGAQ